MGRTKLPWQALNGEVTERMKRKDSKITNCDIRLHAGHKKKVIYFTCDSARCSSNCSKRWMQETCQEVSSDSFLYQLGSHDVVCPDSPPRERKLTAADKTLISSTLNGKKIGAKRLYKELFSGKPLDERPGEKKVLNFVASFNKKRKANSGLRHSPVQCFADGLAKLN